jgi:hypothetical protein
MPPPGRWSRFGLVALPVAVGLLAAFAPGLHRHQDADSIVPVLMSVTPGGWTPYYWEQNRFGMLTALLARPVQGSFENLLFQTFLTAAAAAGGVCLGTYYWSGRAARVLPAAFVILMFFALAPAYYQFQYLSTIYPFGVATVLAYGALVLVPDDRRSPVRVLAAAICAATSAWVGANAALLLGLAVGTRAISEFFCDADTRRRLRAELVGVHGEPARLAVLGFGILADQVLQRLVPFRTTWVRVPPTADWPGLVTGAIGGVFAESGGFAAGAVLACGLAVLARRDGRSVRGILAIVVAAGLYCAIMAILFKGRPRYLQPAALLLAAAAAPRLRDDCRGLAPVVVFLSLTVGWFRLYADADRNLTATLDERLGRHARAIEAADPTFLAGNYWDVWPAVYHTNWQRERAGRPAVWGLSHRSWPTEPLWRPLAGPAVRVLLFPPNPDEPVPEDWLREYRIPDPTVVRVP